MRYDYLQLLFFISSNIRHFENQFVCLPHPPSESSSPKCFRTASAGGADTSRFFNPLETSHWRFVREVLLQLGTTWCHGDSSDSCKVKVDRWSLTRFTRVSTCRACTMSRHLHFLFNEIQKLWALISLPKDHIMLTLFTLPSIQKTNTHHVTSISPLFMP